MTRRTALVCLVLATILLPVAACATPARDGPPVVITKIDYDSTRDGLSPRVVGEGEPKKPEDPASCNHAWEAVSQGTHAYPDPSDPLGMSVAICTPVYCKKCGLVRHECQKRKKRR